MIEKLDKGLSVFLNFFKYIIILGLSYILVISPIFSNIDGIRSFFLGFTEQSTADMVYFSLFFIMILGLLIMIPMWILSFFSKRLAKLFFQFYNGLIGLIAFLISFGMLFWGENEEGIIFPEISDFGKQVWYISLALIAFAIYNIYRVFIIDKDEQEQIDNTHD